MLFTENKFLKKIVNGNSYKELGNIFSNQYSVFLKTDNPDFTYIEVFGDFNEIFHILKNVLKEAKRNNKNIIVKYNETSITLQRYEDLNTMLNKLKNISRTKTKNKGEIPTIPYFFEEDCD
ncbi:MAG: hypothetical protein PHF46_03035 [Candidatus Gracilibacteria bacterium]|nr:hypothetical protein [Candidatus Gracilibacteria bacterium]MDD4530773.1 hypothetical protein [Candidatus Gracilibacteria bacterium]